MRIILKILESMYGVAWFILCIILKTIESIYGVAWFVLLCLRPDPDAPLRLPVLTVANFAKAIRALWRRLFRYKYRLSLSETLDKIELSELLDFLV